MRQLLQNMNFIADTYLRAGANSGGNLDRFAGIYQQLGLAWEYLGLQCRHGDGYRRVRDGKLACRICGHIKGSNRCWILLPREGSKRIGRMATPTSQKIFPNKKAATVIADTIQFHGARLVVDVHNRHESHIRYWKKPITIADERTVRVCDRGVECYFDDHLVCVRTLDRKKISVGDRFGGFPGELPKRTLKKFPVIFDYDKQGNLLGLTILKPFGPRPQTRRRPAKPHSP